MILIEVLDGPAIGDHVSIESPFPPQNRFKEFVASATRRAQESVVGAHHGVCLPILDGHPECRQVRFAQIPLIDDRIEHVALRFRSAVNGKMLRRRDRLEVERMVPLHAFHELHSQPAGQVRVFAEGLHAASPPGITEDVDVWRPEGESLVDPSYPLFNGVVMLCAGFIRNRRGNTEHQLGIPHCREPDRLRKNRGPSRPCNAMQGFIPPVIGGYAEAFNRRRIVEGLLHLLVQRHSPNEVIHAVFERAVGILIRMHRSHSMGLSNTS